jgi:hypothetical protein
MTPPSSTSRLASAGVLLGSLATLALRLADGEARGPDRPAWLVALGVTLVLLALRLALMTAAARKGELPWPRLLVPAILLAEGAGLWLGDGAPVWQHVRIATAIGLELAVIALAVRQLRRAAGGDELPEVRLARTLGQLVPPGAARLIAFELVIFGSAARFVLGGWRRPLPPGFSYHRASVLRQLLAMLPLLAIADVALLELVILPRVGLVTRVIAHALAIYGLVWLIGLYASVRARPHRVHAGHATLHRGVLGRVELPLDQIASIGELPSFADDWKARAYRKRAISVGINGGAVLDVRLRAPVRPIGVLGPGRARDHLLIAVDDPVALRAALGGAPG